MVRSRLELLVHGSHQRARQCVTPIQHIDISVDDENDVPDVKFQTKNTHIEGYSRYIGVLQE